MKRFIFPLALLALVGCQDGVDVAALGDDASRVPFEFTLSELPFEGSDSSRATIATEVSSAGLYGYRAGISEVYIENAQINSSGEFEEPDTYFWPAGTNSEVNFLAYSPYADGTDSEISNVASTYEDNAINLTLSYSVPAEVASQTDLMVASATLDNEDEVDLAFSHALTAVKFEVADSSDPVTEVTFSSIYTSGDLSYDGVNSTWSTTDHTKSDVTYTSITAEDNYLMMVPQTLTAGTTITYTQNDLTKTLKLIEDLTWQPGYEYTFTVSALGDSYVEVDYTDENPSNCYILNPSDEKQVFYIPIEGRINDFWTNYEDDSNYRISDGDEWHVDILWNDIEVTAELYNKGFRVERVTEGYTNTTDNNSALKVTLPAAFNSTETDANGSPKMHGNIVVGIRKGEYSKGQDNYCWSWHFWITDYNPYEVTTAPIANNATQSVTGGNIFTYGEEYYNTNGRKWIMDRSIGASQIFSNTSMIESGRTNLYYQYGRKDPFTTYLNDTFSFTTTGTVKNGVLNPTKFKNDVKGGITSNDPDYQGTDIPWNDKKKTDMDAKSIFDPSPLGWKIPKNGTWDDFNKTTFTWNTSYPGRDYTPISGVHYQTSGVLNNAFIPYNLYVRGSYWSSSPLSDERGFCLYFDQRDDSTYDGIIPNIDSDRWDGCLIIPIQE